MDFLIKSFSTLGPIGTKLPAPGTFGSIAGLLVFSALIWFTSFSPIYILGFFAILFLLGIPLCTRAEMLLKKADPPEVIWDEFTAIPLVFIFCLEDITPDNFTKSFLFLTVGFIFFRIFDIAKPIGIQKLQSLPKGYGVMIDDLAAAFISACLLLLFKTFSLSFS
jgi:phosphatidylglycerophosphatase A